VRAFLSLTVVLFSVFTPGFTHLYIRLIAFNMPVTYRKFSDILAITLRLNNACCAAVVRCVTVCKRGQRPGLCAVTLRTSAAHYAVFKQGLISYSVATSPMMYELAFGLARTLFFRPCVQTLLQSTVL